MAQAALAALAVTAVASSIAGGISANSASKKEANLMQDQGQLAQDEANQAAERHAQDVSEFAKTQKLAFLKNGVTLEGSPLLTLDRTLSIGQQEVNSIVKRGAAQKTLYDQQAQITRNSGRAALISGFGNAAGTAATLGFSGYKAGVFGGGGASAPATPGVK